jgi:hypothetical protein
MIRSESFQEIKVRPFNRFYRVVLLLTATALVGCATSGGGGESSARYSNFLVVGIAGSFDSRAQFERAVVSGLRAEGVEAKPYYLVTGGNTPVRRANVLEAIDEHGFDAVVVTYPLDTEADIELRSAVTGTKVSRKQDGFLSLFRYDYEELNDPLDLSIDTQVKFRTELFDAATQEMVWSSIKEGRKAENIAVLIDDTGKSVVAQLKSARKIAR